MPETKALASVVVPAHNEAGVIGRCLHSLFARSDDVHLDVVVVANGCTDATAEVARQFPVRVVETPVASKAHALNLGDQHAGDVYPRIYLDADIVLGVDAAGSLTSYLEQPGSWAAAPAVTFDTQGCSWVVRAFYRHLLTTPYVRENLVGLGVYGLSRAARGRFGTFPAGLIADDLYVSGHFEAEERMILSSCTFTVRAPRTTRALVRVRRRVHAGNVQSLRQAPHAPGLAGPREALAQALAYRRPWDGIAYLGVIAIARYGPGRRARWGRDDTTR